MSPKTMCRQVAEGKTKIIYEIPNSPNQVLIESKDDITAGDGAKHDTLPGKGVHANTTTCNCFKLLGKAGIPTHFIKREDDRTFYARRLTMFPVKLVARRIATGSYLKRQPDVAEGTRFYPPVLEFFAKDDTHHDPLIIYDFVGKRILSFNAKQPLTSGATNEKPMGDDTWLRETVLPEAITLLEKTFLTLETAWAKQEITLVDLKIECGFHQDKLIVGDVIDNDSWRLWPQGNKAQMVDKQVYRNLPASTPGSLRDILAKYAWVAQATQKFLI